MKYAFNKATGEFVDSEDSATLLGLGYNPANLERLGLTAADVVIVEADKKDAPWHKKLVAGKLVADTDKLNARAAVEQAAQTEKDEKDAALVSAHAKLVALKFTDEEIAALGLGN